MSHRKNSKSDLPLLHSNRQAFALAALPTPSLAAGPRTQAAWSPPTSPAHQADLCSGTLADPLPPSP